MLGTRKKRLLLYTSDHFLSPSLRLDIKHTSRDGLGVIILPFQTW